MTKLELAFAVGALNGAWFDHIMNLGDMWFATEQEMYDWLAMNMGM